MVPVLLSPTQISQLLQKLEAFGDQSFQVCVFCVSFFIFLFYFGGDIDFETFIFCYKLAKTKEDGEY